ALAELFRLFDPDVRCVVLNSCYSATQAAEIVRHIDYVVGMKQAIGDEAAIEFSRGFYDALVAGESYERAFAFGCSAIQLESLAGEAVPQAEPRDLAPVETPVDRLPEHLKPVLLKRSDTGSTPPPTPPGWRLSWGRRTIVTLSLLVALVLGIGILGVLFRGGCGQDQGGDDDDGPVVAAAAGLANAYDQPRGSLPDPPGPNTNYYRLRQAVFLATRAWRAEKPLLAQALEQLRRSRFFEARAYPDAPEDFPKLLAEVDNILAVRLGWLKDAVLPALLRTGQPQSIPVPREARFDFRPEPGAEPAERFSRIVEVQEEIRLIEAARR
ncbi:MAG TPA: hypothetical protein VF590_14445, partial [Isosphaeraceae bacterium]